MTDTNSKSHIRYFLNQTPQGSIKKKPWEEPTEEMEPGVFWVAPNSAIINYYDSYTTLESLWIQQQVRIYSIQVRLSIKQRYDTWAPF